MKHRRRKPLRRPPNLLPGNAGVGSRSHDHIRMHARLPRTCPQRRATAGKSIGWHKGYVTGSRPDLRVPVRQVHLTNGTDVTLYDTSGPYTDPTVDTDVRRGLAPLRENWIIGRGDTEEYAGRPVRPEDDGLKHTSPRGGLRNLDAVFPGRPRQPRRGRDGAARSPSSRTPGAARSRPEMEYVAHPRERRPRGRPRGDRRGPRGAAGQRQPPGDRADDHRQAVPGEGQRQHRQLRGHLLHRGGGGEDDLGDPLGRRHGHGPLHRPQHPHHPRVGAAQLPRPDRHRAALPGAGEGRRPGRGADLGDLQGHRHRAGRAGRRLHDGARRRAAAVRAAHRPPQDRHRLARRLDHGRLVPGAPQGELPLRALRGALRDPRRLRRHVLARRRPAPRLDRGRQRRGAVRRVADARRAQHRSPSGTTSRR